MDLINASPIIVLAVVGVLAWFTGNKVLKLATLGVFFFYPVLLGKVEFQVNIEFIKNVVSYWLTEALQSLLEYVKQSL
jgi:hypothetical protein